MPAFPLPCETATPYDVRSARLTMLALVRRSDMDPRRRTRAVTPDSKPIDIAHAYRDPRVLYAVAWSFLHDVTAYDKEKMSGKEQEGQKFSSKGEEHGPRVADSKGNRLHRSKSFSQYKGRRQGVIDNNDIEGDRFCVKPSTAIITGSQDNLEPPSKSGLTTTPVGSRHTRRSSAIRSSGDMLSATATRRSFGMNSTERVIQSIGRRYPYKISNSPYRTDAFPIRESNRIPSNIAYRRMHEMHILELERQEREMREEAQRSSSISDTRRKPVTMYENNVSDRNYNLTSPVIYNNTHQDHFSANIGSTDRHLPF